MPEPLTDEQIEEVLRIVKGSVEGYYLKRRLREELDPEGKMTTRELLDAAAKLRANDVCNCHGCDEPSVAQIRSLNDDGEKPRRLCNEHALWMVEMQGRDAANGERPKSLISWDEREEADGA